MQQAVTWLSKMTERFYVIIFTTETNLKTFCLQTQNLKQQVVQGMVLEWFTKKMENYTLSLTCKYDFYRRIIR